MGLDLPWPSTSWPWPMCWTSSSIPPVFLLCVAIKIDGKRQLCNLFFCPSLCSYSVPLYCTPSFSCLAFCLILWIEVQRCTGHAFSKPWHGIATTTFPSLFSFLPCFSTCLPMSFCLRVRQLHIAWAGSETATVHGTGCMFLMLVSLFEIHLFIFAFFSEHRRL